MYPLSDPKVAEVNPYTVGYQLVDDNQKALRRVDDGAKRIAHDMPLDDVEEVSMNKSVEEFDTEQVTEMEEERAATNAGFTQSLIGTDREDLIPQALSYQREDYAESAERAKKAITPFYARNYNTPGAENLTDKELLDISIDDYTLNAAAVAMDDQGGWEVAGDILNMMVIPDQAYNAAAISDGNWFTSAEGMESLAMSRQALAPDERILFDQALFKNIQGIESADIQAYLTMLDAMGKNPNLAAEHFAEKAFLITDLAGIGASLVKGLKSLNKMRQLSKVGDNYTAAKAADLALSSDEASRGLGITKLDAAMSGNPLKSGLKDDILSGTTTSPASETYTRTSDVDKYLEQAETVTGVRALPTERERADFVAKWRENMEANDTYTDVEVSDLGDAMEVSYKTPEGGENIFVNYTLDNYGGFTEKEVGLGKAFTRGLWSPMFMQGLDKDLMVNAPIIGEFKRAKVMDAYMKAGEAAIKPIRKNKASLEKVNHVLNKMNGQDIPNDYHSMVNVGIGGTRLTDKEFQAFKGMRKIFDHMHMINNDTMRRELNLRGVKHLEVGGEQYYGKAYDNAVDAMQAYHMDVDNNQVMSIDGSVFDRITKEVVEAQYAEGKILAKVDGSDKYGWFRNGDNNHSRYAFVERSNAKGVPDNVLPYTPNYVPRSRHEANYFVRKKVPMTVNGNKMLRERTVAWARTEAEANKYLAKLSKTDKDFNMDEWSVAFDREMAEAGKSDMNAIRMNGGMYRGSRSSTGIEFAGDATEGKTVDALDTLQRAMQYTSDRAAMSEMRMVMRHRWYQDAGNIDPEIMKLNWNEARGAIKNSNATPQVKAKLLSTHSQISNVSSVPTQSEQALQGSLRAIGKHFDGKGKEKIARYFYDKSKSTNPINALKGASFHMMLGAFNPAQYLVQMMGAAAAVGANPVSFTKAAPRILAASMTDLIDNKNGLDASLRWLRKRKVITENVKEDIEFWRGSGMYESVLRNNADFDNSGKYMPLDSNAVQRAWRSMANKSTVFYEAGELANMRTSFFTALEHERSLAGKNWKYNEKNLQKVVARAEQYRLGMSSANKAEYQKGILALPTQFKSIYTKFLEAIMGDNFTVAEKSRIVGSQIALFGATGVPFINYWSDNLAEMFLPEDATAEQQRAFKEGAVGWLISDYWDIDAAISGRVAIAGDIIQEVEDMLFSEEPFLKSFMGASFTTTSKSIDAFKNMAMAGKMLWDDETIGSYEKVGYAASIAAQQLAQIPTTSRRLMEAYVMSSFGEVRTSKGRTLYKIAEEDLQMRDVLARAMGFSSTEMQDIYETNQALYGRKEKIRAYADFYIGMLNNLTIAVDAGDEATVEGIQMVLSAINNSNLADIDKQEIRQAITSGLKDREFAGRTVDDWLKYHGSKLLSAKGKMFPTGEEKFEEAMK